MGTATATLNTDLRSAQAPAGAVGEDITHLAFWGTIAGTVVGDWMFNSALSNDPDAITLGQRITFDVANNAQALVITYTDDLTPLSDYACEQALRGIFRVDRYLTMHTANPTEGGSAAAIAGIAPLALGAGNLTFDH